VPDRDMDTFGERTPPRAQLTDDFSKHLLSLRAISNFMLFELW